MPLWSDDDVARARRLFEETSLSLGDIEAHTGVPRRTFGRWACDGGWVRHPGAAPPRGGRSIEDLPWPAMAKRVRRVLAVELGVIEARLAAGDLDDAARERIVRSLAAYPRIIRDLAGLEALARTAPGQPGRTDPDDGFYPTLDAMREDIARRLEALGASEHAASAPGDAPGEAASHPLAGVDSPGP